MGCMSVVSIFFFKWPFYEWFLKVPHTYKVSHYHDDVIKWKHFPRNWSFVGGDSPVPVNSPHKGQWRRALMFSLICVWINGWVNNREAGDLRCYHGHYDVSVMMLLVSLWYWHLSLYVTLEGWDMEIRAHLDIKTVFTGMGISIIKIRCCTTV